MKTCNMCGKTYRKPHEKYFHKRTSSPDGLQYECKTCHYKHIRQHYKKNKKYYNDKAVAWMKAHKKPTLTDTIKALSDRVIALEAMVKELYEKSKAEQVG